MKDFGVDKDHNLWIYRTLNDNGDLIRHCGMDDDDNVDSDPSDLDKPLLQKKIIKILKN